MRRFDASDSQGQDEIANVVKTQGEVKPLEQKDVISCFQNCTENEPHNPIYWRSLALANVPEYLEPWESGLTQRYREGGSEAVTDKSKAALAALRQVLTLKPNDFDSLYLMSLILAPSNSADAQIYLEKASRRVGVNAVLWYFLAEQRFHQANQNPNQPDLTIQEKALEAVEYGNQAAQCQTITLSLPVPALLKSAFGFRQVFGLGDVARIASTLSTYLARNANDEMKAANSAAFLKTTRAMMTMGLKVSGNVDLAGFNGRDAESQNILRSRALMGIVNCYQAYGLAKKYQESHADPDVKQFLEDNAAVLDEVKKTDLQLTGSY